MVPWKLSTPLRNFAFNLLQVYCIGFYNLYVNRGVMRVCNVFIWSNVCVFLSRFY